MRKINQRINTADGGVGFSERQKFRTRLSVNIKTEIRELLGSYEISFQLKLCNSTSLTVSTKEKPTIQGSDGGHPKGTLLTLVLFGAKVSAKRHERVEAKN